MAFTEDFSIFFDTNGFGVEALYTPTGKPQKTITVIFDDRYEEVLADSAVPVGDIQPKIWVAEDDVLGAVAGEPIIVNSTNYKIAGPPQPDGTGVVLVRLENQD